MRITPAELRSWRIRCYVSDGWPSSSRRSAGTLASASAVARLHSGGSLRPAALPRPAARRLGRRQHFAEDLGHGDRLLHPLVQQESQPRRVAELDAVGDLGLQEAGRALQPAQAQVLLRLVAHHRHVDLGVAQVVGDLDVGDGHVADARILQLGQDRHADDFADGFGGFLARREDMAIVTGLRWRP